MPKTHTGNGEIGTLYKRAVKESSPAIGRKVVIASHLGTPTVFHILWKGLCHLSVPQYLRGLLSCFFLGAFAELRKAAISCVMPVSPSVRPSFPTEHSAPTEFYVLLTLHPRATLGK